MKHRKTLVDVATAAGVSKMTASRALRADKDVSPKTRDRVIAAAQKIGYFGNHLAASLSSERSDLIGVIVPSLSNIVFPQVMSGVTDALLGTGFQPAFGVTEYDVDREYEVVGRMLSWRPAGMIITGVDQSERTLKLLQDADVPVVQIMDTDGEALDSVVGFSHTIAGQEMAEALIAAGRRRFGYIGCNLQYDLRATKRRQGFEAGLKAHGLRFEVMQSREGLSSVGHGRDMTARLLGQNPELDCIYYSNDDVAFGGVCHCLEQEISVPERLALAGFNGIELLQGFPGKIATSVTLRRDIGRAAVELIIQSLKSPSSSATPEKQRIVMQPEVQLGDLASLSSV